MNHICHFAIRISHTGTTKVDQTHDRVHEKNVIYHQHFLTFLMNFRARFERTHHLCTRAPTNQKRLLLLFFCLYSKQKTKKSQFICIK